MGKNYSDVQIVIRSTIYDPFIRSNKTFFSFLKKIFGSMPVDVLSAPTILEVIPVFASSECDDEYRARKHPVRISKRTIEDYDSEIGQQYWRKSQHPFHFHERIIYRYIFIFLRDS